MSTPAHEGSKRSGSSPREFTIEVGPAAVSALYLRPRGARALLVLAHGAGAGMRHPFMKAVADRLAAHGIATLRYQFPYMEGDRRRPPDRKSVLLATVHAAVTRGRRLARGVPLLAGGKSMGGRMTSLAAAEGSLDGVTGIVFFGFPLHPPGKPSSDRAAHLAEVAPPMLFLQGTRDALADLSRIRSVCRTLGSRATLRVIRGGDHSFHVLKRSGRTDDEVLEELAEEVDRWVSGT